MSPGNHDPQMLLPIAPVIRVQTGRSTRTVTVSCPFCRRKHLHGWSYVSDGIGSRVAHCSEGRGRTYFVPVPDGGDGGERMGWSA